MERIQVHPVPIGTNELDQALAHGRYAGIGEGKAEDVLGLGIGFEQNLTDPRGQDVRFPGAWPGYDHHGAFNLLYGNALSGIEFLQLLKEGFRVSSTHVQRMNGECGIMNERFHYSGGKLRFLMAFGKS